jgi:magnesium transporter
MIEDANQAHQRAKLDIYGNVLFIVLRTAQLDSGGIQYGETHLVVGKGFVVSIRHGASASYAEVRQRCERNPELLRLGESAIMYAILDFVGDNYFPIIDKITEELEAIEEEIFSVMPASDKIERIYRLRAGLLSMRHAVAPMIEICNQLRRHDFPGRSAAIKPYLRDVNDHVLLVNEAIVDLRERLTAAFEASLLLSAARQNDIVKKLGSWAAILAVPTAVAGIYGMNFKYMPETGMVLRLSRRIVADAGDLQYPLLLLSEGRLALACLAVGVCLDKGWRAPRQSQQTENTCPWKQTCLDCTEQVFR